MTTQRKNPGGRIAYVDGRYLPHPAASVHIEDRGLQFADAVYEVFAVNDGKLMDEEGHFDRLERSLRELAMKMPMARSALKAVVRETLRRNRLKEGLLYLQVTRGAHRRDHALPEKIRPTLILTARALDWSVIEKRRENGVAVMLLPDIRWSRCDIKTTGLLPNALAKTEAKKGGAFEAWLVDKDGLIAEGASTNAWIVTADNVLVTRDLKSNILAGVTRGGVLRALNEEGSNIRIEERGFSKEEAYAASEAFLTSASGGVIPVIRIDKHTIAGGKPGPVTKRIHGLYRELSLREAGA
jgi:D-alanine transaminase